MDAEERYTHLSSNTISDLNKIAQSEQLRQLSQLSLPEIEKVVSLIGKLVPAGNVPGMILNGLARLSARRESPIKNVRRDIDALFRGAEQQLDKAVYAAFFAGPAAVIWAYQNMLKLAGKTPEDSFPEGTWQFYVDYALREDTARHTNETHGFYTHLKAKGLRLKQADRMAAWVMAAASTLHHYDKLLENEWRERVYIHLLEEITTTPYAGLYRRWERLRPYRLGADAKTGQSYPHYRREAFDRFLDDTLRGIPSKQRHQWLKAVKAASASDLPAYQKQMTLLAYLHPDHYGEIRTAIPRPDLHIGIIYQGHYYLIPACQAQTEKPADLQTIRAQTAALVNQPAETPAAHLSRLAQIKRAALPNLYKRLTPSLASDLESLRKAPIWLNFDQRSRQLPLADLRQAERGVGDHALTLFDTGDTTVFDQSHIFFDGAWGAALAEIMTNEAILWADQISQQTGELPELPRPYCAGLTVSPKDQRYIDTAPSITPEASAETSAVNLRNIQALRRVFQQRSEDILLTVNDLLMLYRAIHAVRYTPAEGLLKEISALPIALEAVYKRAEPAILIPIDASLRSPRDRLYPMTFQVPLQDLNFLQLHANTLAALEAYELATPAERADAYGRFDALQRRYLGTLAGFGAVLNHAKELAMMNQSPSVATIKLLAHLPTPLQRLLDQIPHQFDVLNDIIKGREVFSNVGAVVETSTLTRFITAKDDNEKKTLAWGVLTDAGGVLRITLRDFRPHVAKLKAQGRGDVANTITEAYLYSYAEGLNQFIREVSKIAITSREAEPEAPPLLT